MALLHLLLVLSIVGVWGFNFVVIKIGLQEIPPVFLCFARFFLTSIPAVFFVKKPEVSWSTILLYGWVMFAFQFALLFTGVHIGVSAGLASILLQLQAFFAILMAVFWLREKLLFWTAIGALVSFSGIGVIALNSEGEATLLGLTLVVLSSAFWGLGSIIAKKAGKINMMSLVVWGSFVAWPPLLLTSFLFEGVGRILPPFQHPSWSSVGSVLFITFFSTFFGFSSWNWLIQKYSVAKISPFTLLVPSVAMICCSYFLGESLQPWKIFAGILVVGGLCIHLMGSRRKEKAIES